MYFWFNIFLFIYIFLFYKFFIGDNNPNQYMSRNLPKNRKLIKTSLGNTSVYLEYKKKDKLILLVPGFGSSLDSFKECFNYYANYDVISLDFYGRGWSDGVKNYNINTFIDQIHEVLEHTSYQNYKEINIIACSMGCILTDEYLKKYKPKINKVIFIAPAGLTIKNKPFYYKIFKKKYINKLLFTLFAPLIILQHNRKCYNVNYTNLSFIYFMLNHNGYIPCLLDTFNNIDLDKHQYSKYNNLLILISKDDRVTKFDKTKFLNIPIIEFNKYGHSELIYPTRRIIYNFLLNNQFINNM